MLYDMRAHLSALREKLVALFFPPVCISCQDTLERQDQFLCSICMGRIALNSACYCPRCMKRAPAGRSSCSHHTSFLLAPATFYSGPIPALIHAFKYARIKKLELLISSLACIYLDRLRIPDLRTYTCVPIPLHPLRELGRGFNQSDLIARRITEHAGIPLQSLLVRRRHTPPQARSTSHLGRQENLRDAFVFSPHCDRAPRHVLLIDDVCTSGATLDNAARVLRKYGTKKIIALVIAKA